MPKRRKTVLGPHPAPDGFGCYTNAQDGKTQSGVAHRSLSQDEGCQDETIKQIRQALVRHHANPAMLERDRRRRALLRQLGYAGSKAQSRRLPRSPITQKGNLAEVFLAEYLVASADAALPVYRLRYNPNVEQSMKGDDVLAFDLDADPVRVIIGEAKFRSTPSKASVVKIISGLVTSHQAGLPTSLQFIADRLFESNDVVLGQRVEDCARLLAIGKLDLRYVGLLMGTSKSRERVDEHAVNSLRHLAMISVCLDSPSELVDLCYDALEDSDGDPS